MRIKQELALALSSGNELELKAQGHGEVNNKSTENIGRMMIIYYLCTLITKQTL